jgi:protein phosphatase
MSEFGGPRGHEAPQRIVHEIIPLDEGPIDLYLADQKLQVIDPRRDMESSERRGAVRYIHASTDCLVIDRDQYDIDAQKGYKGLRTGERITLGRAHHLGRFSFNKHVSLRHVSLYRHGDNLEITDLDSTNGTYVARPLDATETPTLSEATPAPGEAAPTPEQTGLEMAAGSVAEFRRPGKNEDRYFTDLANRSMGVFDGIGSHAGSAEAAELAANSVRQSLEVIDPALPRPLAELALREALENAHLLIAEINQAARAQNPTVKDIGTTAIVAKILETESAEPYALIGGAGDSRAYLIRDGRIEYVTLDHVFTGLPTEKRRSLQETLSQVIDLSKLKHEDYVMFKNRHIIDSSLGPLDQGTPTVSVSVLGLQAGDRLLLTSDGIPDNLTDGEIEAAVRTSDEAQAVVDELIEAATARSLNQSHPRHKPDDMTAALLAVN